MLKKVPQAAWILIAMVIGIILGYMIFVYWIFGGKLREGEGYH